MGQRRVGAVFAAIHAIEGHHPGFYRRQIVIHCAQRLAQQDAVEAHNLVEAGRFSAAWSASLGINWLRVLLSGVTS